MPQNFIAFDRAQELLLPPDLRDWLPANHLAWFVLGAVEEMELDEFVRPYAEPACRRRSLPPRSKELPSEVQGPEYRGGP